MARKEKKAQKNLIADENFILTQESPFAMQEAYKTLRTNLIFSTPGQGCRKIVVTSSQQGEAKSTTSVNLAIAFAQTNVKVALVDCDLRLPTLALKLKQAQTPGLSNALAGTDNINTAIRHLENGVDLIPAGDVPPNPSELLGSNRMEKLMEALEKYYDVIILDTPPVNTVTDAAILAKFTSGVLLVARQGVATQESISDALGQLSIAEAKVLGFVFTGVENDKTKSYSKKGKYGYGYGYGYAHSYANAANNAISAEKKKDE